MFYFNANLTLYFIFAILIVSACTNEESKSNFIAFIARKLKKKFIFLIWENENSAKEKYEYIERQKTLNKMLNVYISILDMKSLTENFPNISGEKSLIVFYMTEKSLQNMSNKMGPPELTWLCLSYSSSINSTAFIETYIPFNTRFLHASEEQGRMVINEIYQVTKNSPKLTNYYGTWESDGTVFLKEEEDFWERRRNFAQASLDCMVKNIIPDPFHPCDLINWYWNGDPSLFECLYFNVWTELASVYNFTTNYRLFTKEKEESFLDLVQKKLMNLEVDGTVLPFIMTSSRLEYFGFLWPVSSSTLYTYSRVTWREVNFSSYLKPFGFDLWIAAFFWILGSAALLVLTKFASTSLERRFRKKDFKFLRDATDHLIASFSAMCAQTSDIKDRTLSLRIILVVIHILPLILLPAYSGSLISSLTNPSLQKPFSNLEEFENNGQYKLMALKDTFVEIFILNDPRFESIRKKNLILRENEMPVNDERAFISICENKLSHVVIQPVLLLHRPRCRVFAMNEHFGTYFSSLIFPRRSPYLELFNRISQKRAASGIYLNDLKKLALEKLKLNLFVKHSRVVWLNEEPYYHNKRPFTLQDILPLLIVYSCGLALSILILLFELKIKRNQTIKTRI